MVAPSRQPVPLHTAENIADLANPTYIGPPPYTGAWSGAAYDPELPPQKAPSGLYSTDQIKVDVSLVDVVREWSKDVIRGGFTDEYAMLEFSREWFRQRAGLPAGGGGGPPAAGTGAGAALDAGKGTRLPAVDAQAQARRDKEEAEAHTARAEGATEAEVEEERIAAYVYEAEEVEAEGALAAAVAAGTPAAGGKEPAASPSRASSFDFAKGTFVFG